MVERFHAAYERRYGNRFPYVPVQGVSYRVELSIPSERVQFTPTEPEAPAGERVPTPAPQRTVEIRHLGPAPLAAELYARERASRRRGRGRARRDPRGPLDDGPASRAGRDRRSPRRAGGSSAA